MTPHKHLLPHNPGITSDCHRTAVACLFDVHPSKVPHFYTKADWEASRTEWLRSQGYMALVMHYAGDVAGALEAFGKDNPGIYWMLSGAVEAGDGHTVVCMGRQIVHDTCPDNPGIAGPMQDGYFVGEWFIPLRFTK